eukprot:SAG25_NODE_767_length_5466_cov_4.881871_1_plen_65_part_10
MPLKHVYSGATVCIFEYWIVNTEYNPFDLLLNGTHAQMRDSQYTFQLDHRSHIVHGPDGPRTLSK